MGKGAAGVHFADQKTSPTLGATNVLETLDPQRFAATGSSPVGARGGTKAGAVETAIAGAAYPLSIAFDIAKDTGGQFKDALSSAEAADQLADADYEEGDAKLCNFETRIQAICGVWLLTPAAVLFWIALAFMLTLGNIAGGPFLFSLLECTGALGDVRLLFATAVLSLTTLLLIFIGRNTVCRRLKCTLERILLFTFWPIVAAFAMATAAAIRINRFRAHFALPAYTSDWTFVGDKTYTETLKWITGRDVPEREQSWLDAHTGFNQTLVACAPVLVELSTLRSACGAVSQSLDCTFASTKQGETDDDLILLCSRDEETGAPLEWTLEDLADAADAVSAPTETSGDDAPSAEQLLFEANAYGTNSSDAMAWRELRRSQFSGWTSRALTTGVRSYGIDAAALSPAAVAASISNFTIDNWEPGLALEAIREARDDDGSGEASVEEDDRLLNTAASLSANRTLMYAVCLQTAATLSAAEDDAWKVPKLSAASDATAVVAALNSGGLAWSGGALYCATAVYSPLGAALAYGMKQPFDGAVVFAVLCFCVLLYELGYCCNDPRSFRRSRRRALAAAAAGQTVKSDSGLFGWRRKFYGRAYLKRVDDNAQRRPSIDGAIDGGGPRRKMSSTEQRISKEAGAERSAGARNWRKAGACTRAAVELTAGPRAPAAAPASAV